MFSLVEKKAIVTGAGRGIGRAIAVGLAQAGADVALVARTKADLEETAQEIRSLGRETLVLETDLTDKSQIEQAINGVDEKWERLDILINNAGMNIRTPAMDVSVEEYEKIMNTNLRGAFLMAQAVCPLMKRQQDGRIVNITSVAGTVALRTGVVYGMTKAALIQMTKTLSLEWAGEGIRINAIGPWYFRTPLTEPLLQDKAYLQDIIGRTPMKRVGELDELVGPAVFLSSDASSYVTGQTLFVDGGMSVYGF